MLTSQLATAERNQLKAHAAAAALAATERNDLKAVITQLREQARNP
jgi:hypothetical protein